MQRDYKNAVLYSWLYSLLAIRVSNRLKTIQAGGAAIKTGGEPFKSLLLLHIIITKTAKG